MKPAANTKVTDLRKELKSRGLSTVGTKPELLARLEEAMAKTPADDSALDADDDLLDDEDDEELLGDGDEDEEEEKLVIPDVTTAPAVSTSKSPTKEIEAPDGSPSKLKLNREPITLNPAAKSPEKAAGEAEAPKIVKTVITLAPNEKAELRKKKFGLEGAATVAGTAKSVGNGSTGEGAEALKKRNERFGVSSTVTTGKIALKTPQELKLSKRKERFGEVAPETDTKKGKIEVDDEKKVKRAARFK